MIEGKWVVRFTAILAVFLAFFWSTWTLLASIPNVPLLAEHGVLLSRGTDALGVVIFGLLVWSVNRASLPFFVKLVALIVLGVCFALGVFLGFLPTALASSLTSLAVSIVIRIGIWLCKAALALYRDFKSAFGRTPTPA